MYNTILFPVDNLTYVHSYLACSDVTVIAKASSRFVWAAEMTTADKEAVETGNSSVSPIN